MEALSDHLAPLISYAERITQLEATVNRLTANLARCVAYQNAQDERIKELEFGRIDHKAYLATFARITRKDPVHEQWIRDTTSKVHARRRERAAEKEDEKSRKK